LDEAVEAGRQALAVVPADHTERSKYQADLGVQLHARYQLCGVPADLADAIEASREALNSTPADHPEFGIYAMSLAAALRTSFENLGTLGDLDEATEVGRRVTDALPTDHALRSKFQGNSSVLLNQRFEQLGTLADLDNAVEAARQAVDATPADHPDRAHHLSNLASALRARFEWSGALDDLNAAQALRLLEAGRTVLLGQSLDTRSDLSDLRAQHPDLARTFTELRDALDAPVAATLIGPGPSGPRRSDRRPLADRFDAVIGEIRALPGFSSFAGLPSAEELVAYAESGPVVTFNVSSYRSDALLLTADGIVHVPLPELDLETLARQVGQFHQALNASSARDAHIAGQTGVQAVLHDVLSWLWEAAAKPVLTALGYHETPADDDWPRVWWATGGLLGQLPLHAAGYHDDDPAHAGQAVIDRVVSSYTPTIRALAYSRAQAATARKLSAGDRDSIRSLIVAMPTTPDLPGSAPLPFAAREAEMLAARLPAPILLTEPALGDTAASSDLASRTPTLESVLSHLPDCAIAHFACHGAHDPVDPSRSRLLLHDHATTPLTIAGIAPVHLERARLAYLSACRTAFHDGGRLLDEAIHLAAAFQLLGFPHVVATFWAISDPIAVTVADRFYDHLRAVPDSTAIDPDRAAQALHQAVRELRSQPGHRTAPSVWAAYLHAGA
jgi:CHAT domain-containing protein